MEIGNTVRQKLPTIQGDIIDTEYDKGTKQLRHLVSWVEDGQPVQRWFTEAELELVPANAE